MSGNPNNALFNLGVQGDSTTLTLYVSRFGKATTNPVDTTDDTVEQPLRSDGRRIYYWYNEGGSQSGLYRQEIKVVTSQQALDTTTTPSVGDDGVQLIAGEVKSLTFQYFDGTTWQDTWDGTQVGQDGLTPMGPPLAIAITVQVAPSGKGADANNQDAWKTIRHVVAIQTANGVGTLSANPNNATTNAASSTTGGS